MKHGMSPSASADRVTVRLHRTLYARQAIADAADVFAGFATFDVRPDGDHYTVEVSAIRRDVEGDVVAEFCNFALAYTASRHTAR